MFFFVVLNQQIDNFSKAEPGPDICCCWKLLHISPILPRVPLLVNTPAVRTKWSSASEMSKLLKGEMSRHEPNLFIGSRSRWRGISRLSLLINEGIPAEFSQSKHAWKLWMTYGGRGKKKKKHAEGLQSEEGLSWWIVTQDLYATFTLEWRESSTSLASTV